MNMRFGFVIALISVICLPANQEELFLRANAQFQQHEIQQALASYDAITAKGPATWFNRAVCLFQLGDYAAAIVSLHKAEKNASWKMYPAIDALMALSYQNLNKSMPSSWYSFLMLWIVRLINLLSLGIWQLIFLCCWIVVIMLIYKAILLRRFMHSMLLLILLLVVGTCFVIRYRNATERYGLVVSQEAIVKAGPGTDYAEVARIELLAQVQIDNVRDEWVKVHNQRAAGWIKEHDIALIDPS